jgi:hypothetical protein
MVASGQLHLRNAVARYPLNIWEGGPQNRPWHFREEKNALHVLEWCLKTLIEVHLMFQTKMYVLITPVNATCPTHLTPCGLII